MLRASNIPARYKAGIVGLPINMVTNWVGVETPEAAVDVFSSIGIPSEAITSGGDKIIGLKFYHVWVEAYNSHGRWVGMDPSFKQYKYYDGVDINTITSVDVNTVYNGLTMGAVVEDDYTLNLNVDNVANDLNEYKDKLISHVGMNATAEDIFGYREITNKAKGILPPTDNGGIFGISETKEVFSEIPSSIRYTVNYQISGINYTTALPAIAGKSTTISYVPADQYNANLIERYGSIFDVPAFLVRMKPVLKVDGEVVAEGASVTLGSYQTLYSSFKRPDGEWNTNTRGFTVGATYASVIDLQKTPFDLVEKRKADLEDISSHLGEEVATSEMVEEMLHFTGLAYFAKTDFDSDLAAKIQDVVWVRLPAQAIVAQEVTVSYFFWFPWKISRGASSIDVKRNTLNPVSVTLNPDNEKAWMATIGISGSGTEHLIFEELHSVESVSTVKILALANERGIPIYNITSENIDTVLPLLNTYFLVKDNIRASVEKGYVAICPRDNVSLNNWHGQGWIVMNPESGAAGYLLAGRLMTGSVIEMIAGGSGTFPNGTITGNWLLDILYHLHHFGVNHIYFPGAVFCCIAAMWLTLLHGGILLCAVALVVYLQLAILLAVINYILNHGEFPPSPMLSSRRKKDDEGNETIVYMYA